MSTSATESADGNDRDESDSEIEIVRGHTEEVDSDKDFLSALEELRESKTTGSGKRVSNLVNETGAASSTQILGDRRSKRKRISTDSYSPSIASWKSISSVIRRRAKPMASSTPLVPAKKPKTHLESEAPSLEDKPRMQILQASSMESTAGDSVVYYGAPMPGIAAEHREAIFREAFSIDDGASTPNPQRVQEAPKNSTDFLPKLTSTGIDGQELSLSQNDSPESSII